MTVDTELVDVVDTAAEAAVLHHPPLLVRDALAGVLDAAGLGDGPIRETRIGDGHSNITFLIEREGWEGVMRRPPRPPYQAKAHDMIREATIQKALATSDFDVPRIELVEPTGDALGVPFYVMERLDGDIITTSAPTALDHPEGRHALGLEFIDNLARLHAQSVEALGLQDFGRPEGFADRQLSVFGRLWTTHRTRDIPGVEELERWLREHQPEPTARSTIVHGDHRIGNLMFRRGPVASVLATLDWELATIGDPMSDVGYLLSTYPEGAHEQGTLLSLASGVAQPGFPSRRELLDRYATTTGRDLDAVHWWVVLAFWRTAVGLESFYRRGVEGTIDSEFIRGLREGIPEMVEHGHEALRGEWT